MTVAEAQQDLLGLIGIEDASHAPPPCTARILSGINAVLQELWALALPWWSAQPSGAFVHAPTAIAGLTLAKGGFSVTTPAPGTFPAWADGCTVRLGDDPKDNMLAARDAAAATATLVYPYAGSSGSGMAARVFCDCLALPQNVSSIAPPVTVAGEHELTPLRGPRDGKPSCGIAEPQDEGAPTGYLIERGPLANGLIALRMRLFPLPGAEYSLCFDARREIPPFTNLAADSDKTIPVPQNYAESVFMPLLRYHFSTWKHFEASAIRPTLKEQYENAYQILARMKPQAARIGRVRILQE